MSEDLMHGNVARSTNTKTHPQTAYVPSNNTSDPISSHLQIHIEKGTNAQPKQAVQSPEVILSGSIDHDNEIDSLWRRVCDLEYEKTVLSKENEIWKGRYEILEKSNAKIVNVHERSLNGMQHQLELVKVVAALEIEKSTRESLVEELLVQKRKLMTAEEKIKSNMVKLEEYQRNEKVLTHTILLSERRADIHTRQQTAELLQTYETLKAELEMEKSNAADESNQLRLQIEQLQAQIETYGQALEQSQQARQTLEQQCQSDQEEMSLTRERIRILETEAAVTRSKHEQLEKADSQLRTQLKQQSMKLNDSLVENKLLREENCELKTIADELMVLAEKQEEEKQRQKQLERNLSRSTSQPQNQQTLGKRQVRHSLG
uniref:AlNc14C3G508 protein n=1 Tax=Albugo laibachii Nc14 TaxID=890382 RepID=F0W039_9STRA|nr:AlNc14C3G508 [Albugo laibachii Nc14]|eukprot:CCA14410.1 AlNc14C3G508 [Albugo laibachii Nc14]